MGSKLNIQLEHTSFSAALLWQLDTWECLGPARVHPAGGWACAGGQHAQLTMKPRLQDDRWTCLQPEGPGGVVTQRGLLMRQCGFQLLDGGRQFSGCAATARKRPRT
jgi:hypothetical protein